MQEGRCVPKTWDSPRKASLLLPLLLPVLYRQSGSLLCMMNSATVRASMSEVTNSTLDRQYENVNTQCIRFMSYVPLKKRIPTSWSWMGSIRKTWLRMIRSQLQQRRLRREKGRPGFPDKCGTTWIEWGIEWVTGTISRITALACSAGCSASLPKNWTREKGVSRLSSGIKLINGFSCRVYPPIPIDRFLCFPSCWAIQENNSIETADDMRTIDFFL